MSGAVIMGDVMIPSEARTLDGFRRWRRQLRDDAPCVHFIEGDLYLDMAPQDFRSHLPVATEINAVLLGLSRSLDLGRYYGDGGWITNEAAQLSNEPDGFLVRWETFQSGTATLIDGAEGGAIELEGRPDMILEVVSRTSIKKDTSVLRTRYADAGVQEYWLVDARSTRPSLKILVLSDGSYREEPTDSEGWVPSGMWDRSFRLRRVLDTIGEPDFRLDVRLTPRGPDSPVR